MGNEKKTPGCLGYIGDYTTQLCWDYCSSEFFFYSKLEVAISGRVFFFPKTTPRKTRNGTQQQLLGGGFEYFFFSPLGK